MTTRHDSVNGRPLSGLHVDLGSGRSEREENSPDLRAAYLGGRGLGSYLLLQRRVHDIDPLAPESPLIFAPGPLTGSGAPATGRYSISARSPLTGTVFDGNSGGGFGIALRGAGLDYLVVDGALDAPAYLVIDDAGAQVRPAGELWGLDAPEALARLRSVHGRCQAAVIGRAGENGVRFASIVNERGRQLGRGGLGAVMGAKRLKAIVLAVTEPLEPAPADSVDFAAAAEDVRRLLRSNPATGQTLPRFGTSVLVHLLNATGIMPTRNFRDGCFEHAEAISGESLRSVSGGRSTACAGCPVGCARDLTGGGRGPEYESIWAFGAGCGVGDLETIIAANHACNAAGVDAITMGSTIACAMELAEEGALPNGPRFGDTEALVPLVQATVEGRGLGAELALGSRALAARHGRPELSMSVKNLELPAFDPRGMMGQGLAFATSNRGGCHTRANMIGLELVGVPEALDRFSTEGKAAPLIAIQNINGVLDSLVQCKFAAFALKHDSFSRLLSAMIGEAVGTDELVLVGERIWNVERLFNLKAGFTREDDTLPSRLLHEPMPSGPAAGHVVDLTPMLGEYYGRRGWDAEGVPTAGTLSALGVKETALVLEDVPRPISRHVDPGVSSTY